MQPLYWRSYWTSLLSIAIVLRLHGTWMGQVLRNLSHPCSIFTLYWRSYWTSLLSIAIVLRLHGHLFMRLAIALLGLAITLLRLAITLGLAITLRGSISKTSPCVTARARHAEVSCRSESSNK